MATDNVLGRPPSALEQQALNDGFVPIHKIGDRVEGNHAQGEGVIDAIVLFKVHGGYVWGCRFEKETDYFPQDHLKAVAKQSD